MFMVSALLKSAAVRTWARPGRNFRIRGTQKWRIPFIYNSVKKLEHRSHIYV
jgi:hypothetical protein